jgi:hypothetical protein
MTTDTRRPRVSQNDSPAQPPVFFYIAEDSVAHDLAIDAEVPAAIHDNSPTDEEFQQWKSFLDISQTHMIEYIAAEQSRNLDDSNVGNYLARALVTANAAQIVAWVRYAATVTSRINLAGEIEEATHSNKWLDYHTTGVSSPSVVKKYLEDCPQQLSRLVTQATKDLVDGAFENRRDSRAADGIPQKLLALAYTWNMVCDHELDKWFQGKRAYEQYAGKQVRMWASTMRAILDKMVNADAVADAESIDAVMALPGMTEAFSI